jgi:hypothetical protein
MCIGRVISLPWNWSVALIVAGMGMKADLLVANARGHGGRCLLARQHGGRFPTSCR